MTSKPWMPWYVADFVGDTQHLDAAETGAYMLLIGHYWLNSGKLPEGEAAMARVARMTVAQWKRSREALLKFFPEGHNKRADEELSRTAEVSAVYSSRARQAAETRWAKHRSSNAQSNAPSTTEACLGMPISQSQSQKKDIPEADASDAVASLPAVRDIRADLFGRGLKSLATMTGKTPDSCRSLVGRWLKTVNDEAIHVLGAIDDAERNRVADPVAWINKTLQPRARNGHGKPTVHEAVDDLLAQVRNITDPQPSGLCDPAGQAPVRRLPAR